LLFSSMGPRLDAEHMSRRQRLRAALGFFSIAGLGLGASASILWFGDRLPGLESERVTAWMMLLYGVVGMTGLGAGMYLLIRAMLQPQPAPLHPSVEYLKEYVAPDGSRRVRLTENADRSIRVTAADLEMLNQRAIVGPERIVASSVSLAEAEALALEAIGISSGRRDSA
jgi:hypothetical protein